MNSIRSEGMDRLKIEAFKDIDCRDSAGGEFVAMLNPASLSANFEIDEAEASTDGGTESTQYKGLKLGEFTLELLFDDTGAIPKELASNQYTDIFGAIQQFQKVCFQENNDTHKPNFLKVTYGELVYSCKLKSYSVNFTLFASNGKPLRAKINAAFKETKSIEFQRKERKRNSPDVTHMREMKQYQNLVGLGYEIYKRNDLYEQIARVNELNTFRRVDTGTRIVFPPVAKQ